MTKFYLAAVAIVCFVASGMRQTGSYQCMPCGSDCDNAAYDEPGACPHCNMTLVKKSTIVFKSVSQDEVCSYIAKHPGVIILDVRTKEEYEGKTDEYGTLKNAINIPVQELEKRVGELKKMKDQEIIVYCSHSKRSPRASYFLTQHGFKHVTNMEGGMSTMKDNTCKR